MKKIKIESEVLDTVMLSAVSDITKIIEVKGRKLKEGEGIRKKIIINSSVKKQRHFANGLVEQYQITLERI